jgi:hypothetical protein
MTQAKLTYRLRFPRDLEPDAALAALASFSGLPHRARLTLGLHATQDGMNHELAVNQAAAEPVTASLRAAIPSLRLEAIDAPESHRHGWLWQLAPRVAALRSNELPAISAALLSSLFPLAKGEAVSLDWHLRPAVRPVLPLHPEPSKQPRDGRHKALRAKLAEPGLAAYGELHITATSVERRRVLFQRTASMLRSLDTPYGHLVHDPYWFGQLARLFGRRGRFFSAAELAAVIGWPLEAPDLPGLELGAARRLTPARSLVANGRPLGTSDYGGLERPVALSAKASTRGLYILGATGTGKTNLLKHLITSDLEQGRGLVALETNGDLIRELADTIPPGRVKDVVLLDLTDQTHAVGFNPFASDADPSLIADQLGELFERLWSAFWGPRTAQLAHMGLLTLARRKGSTLLDLPRLYLDEGFRARVLTDLDDPVGLEPDWQWFGQLSQAEQTSVTSPLLNKARQFVARPSIRAIVGQAKPKLTMRQVIDRQKVLLVHLPKGLIGHETAQLMGCLVLTSFWQAMAERTGLAPGERHPFALYVDEVQDFASAPVPWDELFAQGRKYGAMVTVAHQNLSQLPRELRETILANARSKAVFALGAADARVMEKLFAPALSADDLQSLDAFLIAAQVAVDDGSVARPVTLRTPAPLEPLGSFAAVQASSRSRYGQEREAVEAGLRRATGGDRRSAPVGRKRREVQT